MSETSKTSRSSGPPAALVASVLRDAAHLAAEAKMLGVPPAKAEEVIDALDEMTAQLVNLEETLAHAEEFIEHMDMSYSWSEWCEGRNPTQQVPDRILGVDLNPD